MDNAKQVFLQKKTEVAENGSHQSTFGQILDS